MHNLCTISDLTVDKPWNRLSRASTGYQNFQLISFFRYSKILDPPKKMGNNLGFNLDTLDAQEFKNV